MVRPVIALVTGFTKSPELLERSLAPLRALRGRGVVGRILYVTWDDPGITRFVAPATAMDGVELVRVPQPALTGPRLKVGVGYQIHNLRAALARIPEDDALIVKLRPDFIADAEFLARKIAGFDSLCAPSCLAEQFDVVMPSSPFAAKLWIPWADANLPLHCEEAAFIGLKCDVAKLADPAALDLLGSDLLTGRTYSWFAHVARYAAVFAPRYPIFDNYIRNFRYFINDSGYRMAMMPLALQKTFFWRLLVANAWILATSFHVDCGGPGELTFYANSTNRDADWGAPQHLRVHPPYANVADWRAAQAPGGMLQGASRMHARLVDDSWQHALFTRDTLVDLTPDNLRGALGRVVQYDAEIPDMAEEAFYATLDTVYRAFAEASAVPLPQAV
jgi:hypothetical protein